MFSRECRFCNHVNPPASKYCTACGAQLRLIACGSCNALNDAAAEVCHRCAAPLLHNDMAIPVRAMAGAESTHDAGLSASDEANIYDGPRTASLPPLDVTLAPASENTGADIDAHGWAGSAAPAFGPSGHAPIGMRTSLAERVRPIIITVAVAALAGIAFYAYRNSIVEAPQSSWIGVVKRGDARAGAAASDAKASSGVPDNPGVAGENPRACSDAVAALGLCPRETTQRKE